MIHITPPIPTEDRFFFLNASSSSLQKARDFVPTRDQGISGYQSMDPRTFDSPRAMRLVLDRPPVFSSGTEPLSADALYHTPGNSTGFYRDYTDIRGGDILYYIDQNQADPYGGEPYTLTSKTLPQIQVDPMGAFRPVYQKIPVYQNQRNSSLYTFDQDQMQFREDLMSLQSRKRNSHDAQMYRFFRDHLSSS